ncbi:MAG: hypothetical protein WBQ84_12160, partial [Methylocella sp.]
MLQTEPWDRLGRPPDVRDGRDGCGEVAQLRRRVKCFSLRRGAGRPGEGLERGEGFEDVVG